MEKETIVYIPSLVAKNRKKMTIYEFFAKLLEVDKVNNNA